MGIKLFRKIAIFALFFLSALPCFAENKQIALTIDDLPFVGNKKNFHLNLILSTLKEQDVPATGFIVAGDIDRSNWPMLKKFREAGFGLGNHTVSHANLNKLSTEAYIEEIELADALLRPVLTEPKYFRFPFLATSSGQKKEKVLHYLLANHYQVAPITIDSKDFLFNRKLVSLPLSERENYLNELKPDYLDFIWQETLRAQGTVRERRQPAGSPALGGLRASEALSRLHPPRALRDDPRGHRLLPSLPDLCPGRARRGLRTRCEVRQ